MDFKIEHTEPIENSIINRLTADVNDAETMGHLTDRQLETIYCEKWFKLFVPKNLGGLALGLIKGLEVEESLARIDGSLGWTVTLCSGASMFVGYMKQTYAREIFKNPTICFGGSGMATGIAEETKNGYLINGCWKYATGAPHITFFTANCKIYRNGIALTDDRGKPLVKSFFFSRSEVSIVENWRAIGLIATAGHTFKVENLFVNKDRTLKIDPSAAKLTDQIYTYPFIPFAEATLAVNTLGMVQHFIYLLIAYLNTREAAEPRHDDNQRKIEELLLGSIKKHNALRTDFYLFVEQSWNDTHDDSKDESLKNVGEVSRKMVKELRAIVTELFPYAGMYGADETSAINRVWRDLFTASQHTLLL